MSDSELTKGRRARTRGRLLEHALELFERQGYEQTTVAHIVAAAGVTEMTFFRHFSAKDRLVVEDPYDPVIADMISAQPRELAPLARTIAGVRAAWGGLPEPESEIVRRRVRIAASTPSLRAAIAAANAETEQIIVERLVADGTDRNSARIAAAATLAGITAALLEWSQRDDLTLSATVLAALDVLEGH